MNSEARDEAWLEAIQRLYVEHESCEWDSGWNAALEQLAEDMGHKFDE